MPSTCAFVDCGENDIVTDFDIIVLQFRTKDVDKKDMLTTSVKYTIISSFNFIQKNVSTHGTYIIKILLKAVMEIRI